ncbi:MAG: DUF2293 domain-containing protein [Pirellula sp.]
MAIESLIVSPGPNERSVRTPDGKICQVPKGWELLVPGDAALTRRVKAAGPTWAVQESKGRKIFSRGIWAPADTIAKLRAELEVERSSPTYAKKRAADAQRREKKQTEYVEDFGAAVLEFLDFHATYAVIAQRLAKAVTEHATPIGSGTVARTKLIPIERRAESAVIAWMRHQTTSYDNLKIERVKGRRREVRRMLAEKSRSLLQDYRRGNPVDALRCPLQKALSG